MLKKYTNTFQTLRFFTLQLLFLPAVNNQIMWNFWSLNFVNSSLVLLHFKRKYFFFKFIKIRKHKKINKFRSSDKPVRPLKIIHWFVEKITTPYPNPKKRYLRYSVFKVTSRWLRRNFKKTRFSRIKRNFLKILRQRIMWANLSVGSLLFGTNKKKNLKKLFNTFRSCNNSVSIDHSLSYKYFFIYFINRFSWAYSKVFYTIPLFSSFNLSAVYFNLKNYIHFNKHRISKRRYLMRFRSFLKKKRVKRLKRGNYLRFSAKNFKKFKQGVFKNPFPKTLIFYSDNLTQLYFFQRKRLPIFNYYLFLFLNVWNIRSFNWKQIT